MSSAPVPERRADRSARPRRQSSSDARRVRAAATRSARVSPPRASRQRVAAPGNRGAAGALHVVPDPRVRILDRPLTSYYLVLGSSVLLLLLGLVMVLSSSSVSSYQTSGNSYALFEKQLLWVGVGLPIGIVASRLPLRIVRLSGFPLLVVVAVGLLLVLVPGFGVSAYGATRWIGVGSWTIQPSELGKLALAIWGADLFVRKRRLLGEWRHLLVPLLPVGFGFCALVMIEPDMGTTICLLLVCLALLWVVGAPGKLFAFVFGSVGLVGAFLAVLEPYRLARLTSFLHPFQDAHGAGYQAVQGIYALSSGGWWGDGLGASKEKWDYLPNAHTDFIFAILGEELGLLGTLLVLVLFGILGYAGIRIAQRTTDPFVRLAAAGITAWLLGQALINIGAVAGLLPITGIPLPLISFGGSSLVFTLAAIGLLVNFARTERGVPAARRSR